MGIRSVCFLVVSYLEPAIILVSIKIGNAGHKIKTAEIDSRGNKVTFSLVLKELNGK